MTFPTQRLQIAKINKCGRCKLGIVLVLIITYLLGWVVWAFLTTSFLANKPLEEVDVTRHT